MKKFVLSIFFLVSCSTLFAQVGNDVPIYLRFPTIPAFMVYKAPDSTVFTRENLKRKGPVMFFVFSPECGHCQSATEMMIKNMSALRHTEIVMVTYLPYDEMMAFYKKYQLNRFPNIVVARDASFFFPTFFKLKNFPSYYIYDRKGKFKQFYEGDVDINKLVVALK
ncbi:MAG: thioredoxin family protein [Chitinophagaceae bacterium]|nr:thioredoxin family protein [Chitinophagaceae bacterium]